LTHARRLPIDLVRLRDPRPSLAGASAMKEPLHLGPLGFEHLFSRQRFEDCEFDDWEPK
jgi:hypothetical protein